MKRGTKTVVLALIVLISVSSIVYTRSPQDTKGGCPCDEEKGGCVPSESQVEEMEKGIIEPLGECGERAYYETKCLWTWKDSIYIRRISVLACGWCTYKDYHCCKKYGKYKVVYDTCSGKIISRTLLYTWVKKQRKIRTIAGDLCCGYADNWWQCRCKC